MGFLRQVMRLQDQTSTTTRRRWAWMRRTVTPKVYPNVQEPSAQEIEDHQTTHLPYRSWCPHCVRSEALADLHRRTAEPPGAKRIATVSVDYFFMGSQGLSFAAPSTEQATLPIFGSADAKDIRAELQTQGRRETRHAGAHSRLGMTCVSEVAAQKRPGTRHRCTEGSGGAPGTGRSHSTRGKPSWSTLRPKDTLKERS